MEKDAELPGDIAELTEKAAKLKTQIGQLENELKPLSEALVTVQQELLRTMDLLELDKIDAHGFSFFKETRSSVQTPKTVEEKQELFKFLEDKGIFLEMASVNSMTLNSLYKDLEAEALKAGVIEFTMPGVKPPTPYTTLKMRKGK